MVGAPRTVVKLALSSNLSAGRCGVMLKDEGYDVARPAQWVCDSDRGRRHGQGRLAPSQPSVVLGRQTVKDGKVIAFFWYYLNAFLNRKRKPR